MKADFEKWCNEDHEDDNKEVVSGWEVVNQFAEDYAEQENPLGKTIIHTKMESEYTVLGVRTECSSNNNLMYLIRHEDDEYFWVYDYEVKFKDELHTR